jgi:hypothetical protein
MFFVDELDRDDGFGRVQWSGFADRGVCALADGFADQAERKVCGEGRNLALRGPLAMCRRSKRYIACSQDRDSVR